jgi:hypothetical protein
VIYMLKVNMLVAAILFGLAGLIILTLFAWTEAQDYARALRTMRRIAQAPHERFVISRVDSRNHNPDSFRTA